MGSHVRELKVGIPTGTAHGGTQFGITQDRDSNCLLHINLCDDFFLLVFFLSLTSVDIVSWMVKHCLVKKVLLWWNNLYTNLAVELWNLATVMHHVSAALMVASSFTYLKKNTCTTHKFWKHHELPWNSHSICAIDSSQEIILGVKEKCVASPNPRARS